MLNRILMKSLCYAVMSTAGVVFAQKDTKDLEDAINAASNFVDWKPGDDSYPKENAKQALENGKACVESG
jgi:hypothetical protein